MSRRHHQFRPAALDGLLEDRLLLHGGGLSAAVRPLDHPASARRPVPIGVFVDEVYGNFGAFNVLVTSYVNVLFNFSGSYPSPGSTGATSTSPDGNLLLTSNYDQTIVTIAGLLDQQVLSNVAAAPARPGTVAIISARIDGSSPDSLVSQLAAIPVDSLASQGPSNSSARAAALVPIAQAIDSAQSDVIAALIRGARPHARSRPLAR